MGSLQRIAIATSISIGIAVAAPGVQAQQKYPSTELARILSLPEVKERLQNIGFHVAPTTPEEHDKNLRADLEVFSRIVVEVGLKAK